MMEFNFRRSYRGGIKGLIFDWAGTTVDYGSFAPTEVFIRLFAAHEVPISAADARAGMGLMKKDHLRTILSRPGVGEAWQARHGSLPGDTEIEALFAEFMPLQESVLKEYAEPISGTVETVAEARRRGMRIGSTTGYLRAMMNILHPEAARRGYAPDVTVCPDDPGVPAGRPYPWMCYQNALQMQVYPLHAIVKVGDTLADIAEGLNAGMWSVGLALTGNLTGLRQEQLQALSEAERLEIRQRAGEQLAQAGAHYVIDGIWQLPGVLDQIEARLRDGDMP